MIESIGDKCVGCYGCINICPIEKCISFESNKEGFFYPKVNEKKCKKCKKCKKVCPVINKVEINNKPIAYACFNKEEYIREQSTSGGIFTLLAAEIVNEKGVVFGAKFNDSFDVEHDYIDNVEEIRAFRGSKYVQSKIGYIFIKVKKFLDEERTVLFSGTPCQIAGLKSFLGIDYKNLICIDIICHGVPSPLVWDKYKSEISKGKKITDISFRDKTYGWKDYSFRMDFEDGTRYFEKGAENKYIRGFIGDIYLRNSCYNCNFKSLHRQSDITLADFWGIENINRQMDDGKGTSLIIVNSYKGNQILQRIKQQIEISKVDLNESIKYNMSAVKSSYKNPRRKYFFKNINRFEFNILIDKTFKVPVLVRLKNKLYYCAQKLGIR